MTEHTNLPEVPIGITVNIETLKNQLVQKCDVGIRLGHLACFIADLNEGLYPPDVAFACGQATVRAGYNRLRSRPVASDPDQDTVI